MDKETKRKNVYGAIRLVITFIIVALVGTLAIYLLAPDFGWTWSLIYGASIAIILIAINFWSRWRRVKKEGKKPTLDELFDKRK